MYTIKEAAARTGLTVPVIRAWERRYGVVRPERTPAGYRIYDETAIARLVAMRRLVTEEGWQPRQAAQRVLDPDADLAALGGHPPAARPGPAVLPGGQDPAVPDGDTGPLVGAGAADLAASLVVAFVGAAKDLDVPAMERILDEGFAAQRFELAVEGVVSPALRVIGRAWAEGGIDVGAEHAASETIRRRLARFFDAAGFGDRVPQVIVGLPPGGHHEIGAFAFAVAARRGGLDVLYLGADVPLESWRRTARETSAPVVVLGVVTPSDVSSAGEVVAALQRLTRPPLCLVGGPLAADAPETPGTSLLPAGLDQAVAATRQLMGSGSRLAD